jgi:hypothetical protein
MLGGTAASLSALFAPVTCGLRDSLMNIRAELSKSTDFQGAAVYEGPWPYRRV